MNFFTVALIVSGVLYYNFPGFQIHEGYADANFTPFQIEEIKNISRTEAENDNKILEGKIKKLENNPRDSKEKNKNLEAQLKGIEESLAETSQVPTHQITQSPCPDSVVLNDTNAKDMLSEYSSDKEAIKCFDTSQVTTMEYPFMKKFVNADISSWDVSSVTAMNVSFRCL